MFQMKQKFSGSFDAQCQEESVPTSLLALMAMVLYGPSIKTQSSSASLPQPAVTISQLLMFNSIVRCRENTTSSTTRHSLDRETPLPVCLGVMIHTRTRKRDLVNTLFDLGLSLSYDRVLAISTQLGNQICEQYEVQKVVCPPQLKRSLSAGQQRPCRSSCY